MKELQLYFVKFEENDAIKKKIYLFNCAIYGPNCHPIIVISYNKSIFFANNTIQKA